MLSKFFLRGITLMFLFFTLISGLFAQSENDEIIKVDVALVNIPVIISDKQGRNISGLGVNDFSLFEDGKQQKIEYLSTQNTPLNIVLLMDTSRSTQDIFEKIKNSARDFIKQLQPTDRCMVISFDSKVQVESEFTSNPKRLDRSIKNTVMSADFGTLLNDAIYATVDKELAKIKGRKAIILITDGKDAGSSKTKNDLIYRLEESDSPIYSIIYPTIKIIDVNFSKTVVKDNKGKPIPPTYNPKQLEKFQIAQQKKNQEVTEFLLKVSEITAGRIFPKEIDNLNEAFKNIADELRKQYLISYYPDDPNFDISRHQIKIKVNKPNVVVRTKNLQTLKPSTR